MDSVEPEDQPLGKADQVKVLYVMGYGRSGSTIIGNILGEYPGFVHLGELRSIWSLGMLGSRVCGCGLPIKDCQFWADVLTEAYGPPERLPDPSEVLGWQRRAIRLRQTRRLLRLNAGQETGSADLDNFKQVAGRIYRAAATVTNSKVVIDTSKHVPDAALLHLLPGVKPYFIHLVRDPRAVAFSWQRQLASPGEGRLSEMPRHSAVVSARSWLVTNLGAEQVMHRSDRNRSILIRYEDFASAPRHTIETVLDLIGEHPGATPFVDDATVALSPNHTAGGNPSRLRTGTVKVRIDEDWQKSQSRADRLVTTGIGLPLLRRYGYRLRPRASPISKGA